MVTEPGLDHTDAEVMVDQFIPFLTSPNVQIRSLVFEQLRYLHHAKAGMDAVRKRGAASLVNLLDDGDPALRHAAVVFAGELGSARAIRPLKKIISTQQDRTLTDAARESLERLL